MRLIDKLSVSLGLRDAGPVGGPSDLDKDGLRNLHRKRQRLMEGFLVSEGMLAPRACTVREMTPLGAVVDIWDTAVKASLLTGPLVLYVPADRKEVDCTVLSRKDGSLTLKFTSRFRERTRNYF